MKVLAFLILITTQVFAAGEELAERLVCKVQICTPYGNAELEECQYHLDTILEFNYYESWDQIGNNILQERATLKKWSLEDGQPFYEKLVVKKMNSAEENNGLHLKLEDSSFDIYFIEDDFSGKHKMNYSQDHKNGLDLEFKCASEEYPKS